MARPRTKEQLLSLSQENSNRLFSLIEPLSSISGHSDEELFTQKRYKWTGSTSPGSQAVSASSSHYQWAIDLIKKWVKSLPGE